MPGKASEDTATEDNVSTTTAVNHEVDLTLTDRLNKKLLSSLLERMNSGTQFDRFIAHNEAMLEELYEDNLIGDPNDLEEIIEQQGDELLDEAEEEQETEGNVNNATADGNENSSATRVEPKKRTVKNPRPKLDPERLKGRRGIAVIEDAFKDFKFHGKGYEKVDLSRVMKRLEHWAHRLYPRFQFDDCLDKIEKLGQKKPVQVYVKKIRMGLETVEEPVLLLDDIEESEINNEAPIDAFDELLSQQLLQGRPENQIHAAPSSQVPSSDQSVVVQSTELTAEQRERMLRNKLIAEERRLARMKERQRTAEVELFTVEAVPVQPSAGISVSNNETTVSSELTLEIHTNNTETIDAEEADVPSTSAVWSDHTICENEETSVFCKVVEFEGTNTDLGPATNKEDTISKPTELGKIADFFKLVDAEETSASFLPVNAEQTDTAVMSLSTEEVNSSSGPIVGQETSAVCMLYDSEQTCAFSMPVDGKDTDVSSVPFDMKETYVTSIPVDSEEPDVTSLPLDTEETYAISMPTDSEEPDVISVPFDTEETYAMSMPIDSEELDVTSLPFDTEETYAISVPTDSEAADVSSMSVDAEEADTSSMLINVKDSDAS